jgi:hypothetical protein
MPATGSIHGKGGVVYLQGAGAEAQLLSLATDWEIDVDYDTEPDTPLNTDWETNVKGVSRFTGSMAGSYDTTSNVAWDAMAAATPRKFYIYPLASSPTRYYYGTCWPKLRVSGGSKSRAVFAAAFKSDGQLAKN